MADALVICPWTMYQRYGDESFLTENYESMKRWIEFQKTTSDNLIRPDLGFGDWLSLDDVKTPRPLIGTAYFSYTAHLVAETARILAGLRTPQSLKNSRKRLRRRSAVNSWVRTD